MAALLEPSADRPGLELDWQAPPRCPDAREVRSWVESLVPSSAVGRVRGRIRLEDGLHRLTLDVTTPPGSTERVLEARDCEALARAAAVIVAVAVDGVEAQARASVPPVPVSQASPVSTADAPGSGTLRVPVDPPGPANTRRGPDAVVLGAEAGVATGLLPGVHGVAEARAGAEWRRWLLRATLTHRFGRVAEQPSGGGARISLSAGGLGVGPIARRGSVAVAVLATAEAGVMVAVGQGLTITRTARSPWLGFGLQPTVRWSPAPWFALQGAVTLTGSALQPRFRIDDGPLIHTASLLGARIGLGVEFRIPRRQFDPSRRPRG